MLTQSAECSIIENAIGSAELRKALPTFTLTLGALKMDKKAFIETVNGRCAYNMHNGLTVTDIGVDFCVVTAELNPTAMNPWDMAHGGFVYSMCDVASGVLASGIERRGVTLSANMQYLRPSRGKSLRAEAKIIKNGRKVLFIETNVYNDEGVHTARGEFQIFILEENAQ